MKSNTSINPPSGSPKTFSIENLGCAKNQVDAENIIALLQNAGWEYRPTHDGSSVIIVNTCGFIEPAKQESIETTLSLREAYPDANLIMAGCLAQRYAESLSTEMPEIDGFFGNTDLSRVVAAVEETLLRRAERAPRVSIAPGFHEPEGLRRRVFFSFPGSTYVKIAEGCSNHCSYCAIPLIRGEIRSRPHDGILEEIRTLVADGIREVNLVAQDLASWGIDSGDVGFVPLVRDISRLDGNFWARMLYIHPDHFPEAILDVCAADSRILPYFDIPFQHASAPVLHEMGRLGDADTYAGLVSRIRDRLPGAAVRSTFLLGFPGETEADFEALKSFISRVRLDWAGFFIYSREEDTPAYSLKEPLGKRAWKSRVESWKSELETLQQSISRERLESRAGGEYDVLIEERVEGEELSIGRTFFQAPEVDGLTVIRSDVPEPGTIVRVKMVRVNDLDIEGVMV